MMPTRAAAWFDGLSGTWRLDRRVVQWRHDGDAPRIAARFSGTATFTREGEASRFYREVGALHLRDAKNAGAPLHAARAYRYVLDDRDDTLWHIRFADGPNNGELYLTLRAPVNEPERTLGGSARHMATDEHLCGADRYAAKYCFKGFDAVTGRGANAKPHDAEFDKSEEGERSRALIRLAERECRIVQHTRVRGPKKNYAIVSVLRPMRDAFSVQE